MKSQGGTSCDRTEISVNTCSSSAALFQEILHNHLYLYLYLYLPARAPAALLQEVVSRPNPLKERSRRVEPLVVRFCPVHLHLAQRYQDLHLAQHKEYYQQSKRKIVSFQALVHTLSFCSPTPQKAASERPPHPS